MMARYQCESLGEGGIISLQNLKFVDQIYYINFDTKAGRSIKKV